MNVALLVPAVNVPLFVKLPPIESANAPVANVVPDPIVTAPPTVTAAWAVALCVPLVVSALAIESAPDGIVTVPLPLSVRLP